MQVYNMRRKKMYLNYLLVEIGLFILKIYNLILYDFRIL